MLYLCFLAAFLASAWYSFLNACGPLYSGPEGPKYKDHCDLQSTLQCTKCEGQSVIYNRKSINHKACTSVFPASAYKPTCVFEALGDWQECWSEVLKCLLSKFLHWLLCLWPTFRRMAGTLSWVQCALLSRLLCWAMGCMQLCNG